MSTPADLLMRIDEFLEATGMAPSSFGQAACSDPSFIADLRAGREPRSATRRRVEKFMRDYRAPGAAPRDEGRAA